jgi:phage terminase large subunit GpA-like protein
MNPIYRKAFNEGLLPDPDFTVSSWADEHRYLSQKASAEPGRWRTDRTPYLKEIMDALSPSSPVQRICFMAGAQVGKSETGNNWLGFVVDHAPGPMLLVQPTVDTAKRFSKQRLAPMIEETPRLRDKIAESRSRDSGNTVQVKEFQGGTLVITGANSAVSLRSMPARYLFLDEIDAYPSDVDGEGDPIQLAEKRTTTFARRKVYMCSTPTLKDTSRIEREFLNSDQRRYFVPCPDCGHKQFLRWQQFKWDEGAPASVRYACEDCGVLIEERHKTTMLAEGEWRPTAEGDGRTAGFHLPSFYSPIGWKSWADIVREFLDAKNDPALLKTFVNTVLGETWEDEYSNKLGAEDLRKRVEFYEPGVVPARGLIVTAGVDVQDNRLAIVLRAWGHGEESWLISHEEIYGDPAQPQLWQQLDVILNKPLRHGISEPIKISAMAVDSGGHFTHEVYAFCRDRRRQGVLAIKGQSVKNKPAIGKGSTVDLNYRGKVIKGGAEVYPVGTDTIKSTIYGRLKFTEEGDGFYHFGAEASQAYFDQLTSEKQITRYVKGFPIREWVKKPGARNEALDCEVYAYAALQWLYTRYNRKTIFEQFEQRLKISPEEKKIEPVPVPSMVANRPSMMRPVRKSNFVTSFA